LDETISAEQTYVTQHVKLVVRLQHPYDWKCTGTRPRQLGFAVYMQPEINFGVD
jgi:hypothetical protein